MRFLGFGDEALATLFAALVGAVISFLLFYFRQKRPQKILCKQIALASLVDVKSEMKERIGVRFDDVAVHTLSQTKILIHNKGREEIAPVLIKFRTSDTTTVLDIMIATAPEGKEYECSTSETNSGLRPSEAVLELPYLNSFSQHGEEVSVEFICDGSVEQFGAIGGGRGWSLDYDSLEAQAQRTKRWAVLGFSAGGLGMMVLVMTLLGLFSTTRTPPLDVSGIQTDPFFSDLVVGDSMILYVHTVSYGRATYRWTTSDGQLADSDEEVTVLRAPDQPGPVTVQVEVADSHGNRELRSYTVEVVLPTPTSYLPPTRTPMPESSYPDTPKPLATLSPTPR